MKRLFDWLDRLERSHSWWAPIVIAVLGCGFCCAVVLLLVLIANLNSTLGAL